MAATQPTHHSPWYKTLQGLIAILAILSLIISLLVRFVGHNETLSHLPLFVAYALGGLPLVWGLLRKAFRGEFGSDLLAGISIVTSLILQEYMAGVFVILMLSGGEALEEYALRRASSVLDALSQRMPHHARKKVEGVVQEVPLSSILIGDVIEVAPHDICPVDGVVIEGHGSMDESYLTGEPYRMPKAPGSAVLSGAINGEERITITASALPLDSRYQKIAKVIEDQAGRQVPLRRLGDALGAWYTPLAVLIGIVAWWISGDARRFLSVLVVATPCPLLIAIPTAIIGAISLAAKRGIVVKDPAALERASTCRTMILDKTGTLTYGEPAIVGIQTSNGFQEERVLQLCASLEHYSKHPLAIAILSEAKKRSIEFLSVDKVKEAPGQGLVGSCQGQEITITGRSHALVLGIELPPQQEGLECVVLVEGKLGAVIHFRDTPRKESRAFVEHLGVFHQFTKVMILSGDRDAEVRHLAQSVGITEIESGLSPEEKLVRVIEETRKAPTLYIGDGINDAPALQAATVGIALGTKSDITGEAADIVVLDPSLERVDEFLHLASRMRKIALQSAVGGMGVSVLGMCAAAVGLLVPLAGAIAQEIIDVVAVANALRVGIASKDAKHEF